MNEETKLIIKAIEGLKQQPNLIKDYVFPIASALFTSFLGAGIAYFTLKYQEGIQIEKCKMNTANKWTLLIEEARSNLVAIKSNYHGTLTDVPLQRVFAIKSILSHETIISESYQELSFILPKGKERKLNLNKWSQIPRIRSMVSNYNYLLQLWEQRHNLNEKIKEKIIPQIGQKASAILNQEEIINICGEAIVVQLIDLNERAIKLTDGLIVEMDSFLTDFPVYAKTKIKTKKLIRYGSVITYSNNDNEKLIELLKPSPITDYSSVESIFRDTSENIAKSHQMGYEDLFK